MDSLGKLERRVRNGDVDAMCRLAYLLETGGDGVTNDLVRAKQLYELAAERGVVGAMNNVGLLLEYGGDGLRKDVPCAKHWYERAAEGGDLIAMYHLGLLLQNGGDGVRKDLPRAKDCFERAAEGGDLEAMHNLGYLLKHGGDGVGKDVPCAKHWLERAVAGEHVGAMNSLGVLLKNGGDGVPKDLARAKRLYERAAEGGDVHAMHNLGILLRDGGDGVRKDAPRAKQLFERVAGKGHVGAMNSLGVLLSNGGNGVPKDLSRAKSQYERAIEGGNVNAMHNLGILLRDGGEGVRKDVPRAKELLERAAENGNVEAMNDLGLLLKRGGDGVAKDMVRAKELLKRSAKGGSASAQANMGNYLRRGVNGFQKNPGQAKQWLERAAMAGKVTAMLNLAKLLEDGDDGVPKDAARAQELYERAAERRSTERTAPEEERQSLLETAFARAVRDSSVIDEGFLVQNVVAKNVNSAADLLWGHNLILLSIRAGVVTRDNIRTIGGSSWYLQENLYYPASKLTEENGAVIDAIYQHAENVGIIANGYALRIGRGIRADMKKDFEGIEEAIQMLSERMEALEGNVGELHSAVGKLSLREKRLQKVVDGLTKSLNQLKDALQKRDKRMQYAQVARCMLSFIPLIGKAIGETTYTAASILTNLTTEDLIPSGVDVTKGMVTEMACVDLSNFQVARYAFSKQVASKLDARTRGAVVMSICTSDFKSPDELQRMLRRQIKAIGQDDASMAMVDIGNSAWIRSNSGGAGASILPSGSGEEELEDKARTYFRFLIHGTGTRKLGIPKASGGVNHLLKECEGLSEVLCDELEDIFFDLSGADDDEVTEEVFVGMFQAVRKKQEKDKKTEKVMEEARKRFRERVNQEKSLSLKYAARVMVKLYKEMKQGGFIDEGTTLEWEKAIETLRNVDVRGDDRIEEAEFTAGMRELLNER